MHIVCVPPYSSEVREAAPQRQNGLDEVKLVSLPVDSDDEANAIGPVQTSAPLSAPGVVVLRESAQFKNVCFLA